MHANLLRVSIVAVALALVGANPGVPAAFADDRSTPADDRRVPASETEIGLSFAPVVRRAAPAVVNISASRRVSGLRSPIFSDPFFERFFGRGFGEQRRSHASLGSGVIVSQDGTVITNHHVIAGADEIRIALADKREFEASVLLTDERTDLAILRIDDQDAAPFPFIEFTDSDDLEVGDLVLAIGNPFAVGQTVTQGIVSALARTQVGVTDFRFFIQTDAAINPGNSGGALIDMTGRLVGINTAIYSRSGGSHGIGFAVPANMAALVARSAAAGGTAVARPWLGARMQIVTADIAEGLGLDRPTGALITEIFSGSPAEEAGFSVGDLIVAIDGDAVEDPDTFGYHFATRGVGGTTEIAVLRAGREQRFAVNLVAAPETVPRDPRLIDGWSPFAGATVMNLSPAVAEELDLDHDAAGVVIAKIEPGSVALRVGLRTGDVVREINGRAIETTRFMEEVAADDARVWRIAIERNGRIVTMALRG